MKQCTLESDLVFELLTSVTSAMNSGGKSKSINRLTSEIIKDVGLEPTSVLRREYDGCSQVDWLIEKMIGEFLIEGRINR